MRGGGSQLATMRRARLRRIRKVERASCSSNRRIGRRITGDYGEVPLPPYIGEEGRPYAERYQTIFARVPGSVAAPRRRCISRTTYSPALADRGVKLHASSWMSASGPFGHHRRPARSTPDARRALRYPSRNGRSMQKAARRTRASSPQGRRSFARSKPGCTESGEVVAGAASTGLYIKPGFRFRVVDAMVTNFHLPRSTLLVLVSAFAGYEAIRHAYAEAIEQALSVFLIWRRDVSRKGLMTAFNPALVEEAFEDDVEGTAEFLRSVIGRLRENCERVRYPRRMATRRRVTLPHTPQKARRDIWAAPTSKR